MKNVWSHSHEWRKINENKFSHIIQLFSLLILSIYVYVPNHFFICVCDQISIFPKVDINMCIRDKFGAFVLTRT